MFNKLVQFLLVVTFPLFLSGQEAKLIVKFVNIYKPSGYIVLSIYNNAQSFPKEGKEFFTTRIPVKSKVVSYTVKLQRNRYYAIAAYQDVNGNGRIDKNFLGIPTEPFGFSNNVKPKATAPNFEQTKFWLKTDTTIVISLIYY